MVDDPDDLALERLDVSVELALAVASKVVREVLDGANEADLDAVPLGHADLVREAIGVTH